MVDKVNNPPHYNFSSIETIDIIKNSMDDSMFHGYLVGNVLKYVVRHKYKGEELNDLKKARWYLTKLIAEKSPNPNNVTKIKG
tara:strand:- start:1974 stop:2222 length:249 start_codon:yes stop_codon:yes gene_type:complete